MEEWVRRWLEEQRRRGVKCLEVKKVGNNYYVYRSTTYWDKKAKKRRKNQNMWASLHEED